MKNYLAIIGIGFIIILGFLLWGSHSQPDNVSFPAACRFKEYVATSTFSVPDSEVNACMNVLNQ